MIRFKKLFRRSECVAIRINCMITIRRPLFRQINGSFEIYLTACVDGHQKKKKKHKNVNFFYIYKRKKNKKGNKKKYKLHALLYWGNKIQRALTKLQFYF